MQARGHGHHHHQTTVEMDRAYTAERPTVHNKNSTALDPRRQEKERKTKDNMEEDGGERDESHAAFLGLAG